jgi:signal transduction histidine kinase
MAPSSEALRDLLHPYLAALAAGRRGEASALVRGLMHGGTPLADMLDLAKIEAGKLELRRQPTELLAFVRACVRRNGMLASRKQVRVELDEACRPVWLSFDRTKIEQVLNNLIGNAVGVEPDRAVVTVAW